MALVKVISNNMYGANFQKLEVGAELEMDDVIAARRVKAGLVSLVEVVTPVKVKKDK